MACNLLPGTRTEPLGLLLVAEAQYQSQYQTERDQMAAPTQEDRKYQLHSLSTAYRPITTHGTGIMGNGQHTYPPSCHQVHPTRTSWHHAGSLLGLRQRSIHNPLQNFTAPVSLGTHHRRPVNGLR
jgi:hypothetical protein